MPSFQSVLVTNLSMLVAFFVTNIAVANKLIATIVVTDIEVPASRSLSMLASVTVGATAVVVLPSTCPPLGNVIGVVGAIGEPVGVSHVTLNTLLLAFSSVISALLYNVTL